MGDKNQNQTQDINQLLQVRREKLANLQQAGKDPFQIQNHNLHRSYFLAVRKYLLSRLRNFSFKP